MRSSILLIALGLVLMFFGVTLVTIGHYVPEPRGPSTNEILFYGGLAATAAGILLGAYRLGGWMGRRRRG
jgi:hypothetical protein